MPTLIIKNRSGIGKTIEAASGRSLMETLREAGFDELLALCGGCCSCATCHVHVEAGALARLPKMSDDENDLLEATSSRDELSRLSCQIEVSDALEGAVITIADED
ncbi:MAG: ferredoxin [Hydrocarboniphaga sp.]|uniref:2Fe-2S iron-sulfur cluster-binding protein n=1 Tax=Hydrocarboniphaga sp. TaxID=2033016 RepID=UPI00262DE81C|nr:2Fe-2S iron-sulfur cluster-binding protein [Hydrocarboniphaga sp.]MDB5969360.1 ferredoxin [Hydrocarboniphaga sp.]